MDKEREPPAEWINQYDFEGMPDYSGIMLWLNSLWYIHNIIIIHYHYYLKDI
jgi:hypothetical protein